MNPKYRFQIDRVSRKRLQFVIVLSLMLCEQMPCSKGAAQFSAAQDCHAPADAGGQAMRRPGKMAQPQFVTIR
jgi:hypothetical protein